MKLICPQYSVIRVRLSIENPDSYKPTRFRTLRILCPKWNDLILFRENTCFFGKAQFRGILGDEG
jgi:hypothetical protein